MLRPLICQLSAQSGQLRSSGIDCRLMDTRIDLSQQLTFFDRIADFHMQSHDLPRNLSADLD